MSIETPSIRQKMPAGLYVVATPIGNLGDATPRMREVLDHADAILCEDTRNTAKLLGALGLVSYMPRLHRFDAHASAAERERWTQAVAEGQCVALVSDAGTPGVSDPGQELARQVLVRGGRVTPVVGPSAVTAFLSASGLSARAGFAFWGFLPRDEKSRDALWNTRLASADLVHVCFESPKRLKESLNWLKKQTFIVSPERFEFAAIKELTKLHERAFTTIDDALGELDEQGEIGEWVLGWTILPAGIAEGDASAEESSDWVKALECLMDARVSASEAAKRVSQKFGVPRNRVYAQAVRLAGGSPSSE